MVEIDEDDRASVIFGDGAFGAIPPNGAVIKATYRVGGGLRGNVAPKTILTIVDVRPNLSSSARSPIPGRLPAGRARKKHRPCRHACPRRVPLSLKRAVTAEDYEALAPDFKGGQGAREATNWNTVKLVVAPQGEAR